MSSDCIYELRLNENIETACINIDTNGVIS